ncbi:MAG: stage V sporulation protein AB, partial [Lachnospirales bacterium]
PINPIIVIIYSLCIGIFFGCLAVSLAEVLNVIPILSRRINVQKGIKYFILSLALGKALGSALYYFLPGFYY